MLKIVLLASLLALCTTVQAGDARGLVKHISVGNNSDVVLFNLTSKNDDIPRCNETGKYSVLLITAGGLAAYQALLEAKRNGYIVRVEGTNACKFHWKSEDVRNLTLE